MDSSELNQTQYPSLLYLDTQTHTDTHKGAVVIDTLSEDGDLVHLEYRTRIQ